MAAVIDRIGIAYRKEYEKNPVSTLFLTILIVCLIIFVVAAIITAGDSARQVLVTDPNNTFMDYFNSIKYGVEGPYAKWKVIYPPLVTIMYTVLGHFLVPFVDVPPGEELSFAMRYTQMGMMSFFVITILTFFLLHWIFKKVMKNTDIRIELLFFMMMLSYPFIYALERGNSILLALAFCLIFLLGYRSENKVIRYLSYIALGFAAGFKTYPAILWLLLARERRYKEAGICAAIVVALLLVPFIFTDGNLLDYLDTVLTYSGSVAGVTNINQLITGLLHKAMGISETASSVVSYTVVGLFTLLSFIVILFDKEMKHWKVVALLSCNLILGFGVGCQYQMVYMAIPILYFLISEKKMTKENCFYTICLAMSVALIPGIIVMDIHPSWIVGGIETMFVIAVAVALLREGVGRLYRKRRDAAERRCDVPA